MISGYVSSVPHVLYIAPTFPLPSPVQKIRKLPLGTKNCPLCIPILCSVISLWLCWEMICSSRRPWLIALRHYFLISCKGFFFSRAFSLGERVSLPPLRRAPLFLLTFFMLSLNFSTFVVTSISKDLRSGVDYGAVSACTCWQRITFFCVIF